MREGLKLTLFIPLFIITFCFWNCEEIESAATVAANASIEEAAAKDPVSADTNALYQYWMGNYRTAFGLLEETGNLSVLDIYLAGRCNYEMEEYALAVEYFEALSPDSFLTNDIDPFLFENYIYYYSDSFFSSTVTFDDAGSIVSNLLAYLDEDSIYYDDTLDIYIYYQLRDENYTALTNQQHDLLYNRMGKYLLGSHDQLEYIITHYDNAISQNIYSEIIQMAEPSELSDWDALDDAIDIAVDFQLYDIAQSFADRHYAVFSDKDYYIRNSAIIDYKNGDKTLAVTSLGDYCASGQASMATYTRWIKYLKSTYQYTAAFAAVEDAMTAFPGYYYTTYISLCDSLDKMDELWAWYKEKDSSLYFMENYSGNIARVFIQESPDYAEKLVERYLAKEDDYYMLMIAALFDYENGDYESAYERFLEIIVNYPFTHEWIVARRYEEQLRDDYRDYYESEMDDLISGLSRLSTKKKYYYSLAIKEIDPDLFETELGGNYLAENAELFHNATARYFDIPSKISEYDALTNDDAFMWNMELYNYVEAVLSDYASTTALKAKYTYYYREIYKKLGREGTIVNRLNARLFDVVGDRRYHMLIPDEMKEELFPLVEFDYLVSNMYNNTNNSLWVMSSFREESHFRKHVKSWVGAVGFAQVMPYTANSLKANMGRPELSNYDFFDNVLMGCVLFRYLFSRYDDNYVFAMGAYNAGEGAINRWVRNNDYTTELWIEAIAYKETRQYIKRIMRTRYYYNMAYDISDDYGYADFE